MMFRPMRRFKQQRPEKTKFQPKSENIKHRPNAMALAEDGKWNHEKRFYQFKGYIIKVHVSCTTFIQNFSIGKSR